MKTRSIFRVLALLLVVATLAGYAVPAVSADILNYSVQETYKTITVTVEKGNKEIPCPPGYRIYVGHLCGNGQNTHEWYVKGPGASTYKWYSSKEYYSVESFPASAVGSQIYCICTGPDGETYSGVATLTAMGIYNQPDDVYTDVGKTASTSVEAAGNGLKYQWYVKDKGQSKFTKSSVTKDTYSFKMTSAKSGRQAYCVVTDKYGNKEKSDVVTFQATSNLKITKQPKDVQVNSKQTASVTVKAQGDGLKYQWYVKDPGKTTFTKSSVKKATYSFKMTSAKSGRQVYCVITDKFGNSVKSSTVTMKLKSKVKITQQPEDASAAAGAKVSTTVKASGDGLKYQWYVKDPGQSKFSKSSVKKATYSFTLTSAKSGRQVYCLITDKYGNKVKSDIVTLTGNITVTAEPKSQTTNTYEKISTSVTATGYGLKYQWYVRKSTSGEFSKSSVKKATYSFTPSASDEMRQVYCIIVDKHGNTHVTDTVTLKYEKPAACSLCEDSLECTECDGAGAVICYNTATQKFETRDCTRCNGTGKCPKCSDIGQSNDNSDNDSVLDKEDCEWCRGTGDCRDCGGSGYVEKYKPGIIGLVRERCGCAGGRCRWCYGSGDA